jgi:DNA-binding MarR family transcriptional regulator
MKVRDVDELLVLPARLAIVASLAAGGRLTFSALGEETGLADGNLHVQTRRLVEGGYLLRSTERRGRRRVTCFELSDRGRAALQRQLERLHTAVEGRARDRSRPPARGELGSPVDASRVW